MSATPSQTAKTGFRGFKVLHVLTENSYASIQVTHAPRDAKVIHANKAFKTLTGYDPHEVIVKTATGNDWNPL